MDNIRFYNSFLFRRISKKRGHHTDNSKGITTHFLARLLRGSARIVTLQREELYLRAGDVFYLPKGLCYHSYWYCDGANDGCVEWDTLAFMVFPSEYERHYAMQRVESDGEIDALFDAIAEEPAVSARSVGNFYLLFDLALQKMTKESSDPRSATLTRALRYIEAHTDFSVPELARHCNMSESGLYAMFQRYAQATPIEVRNKMLSDRAVTLLQTTNLSVEEIAERLGFCNAAYFRKVVKACTGKTPTAHRREGGFI